MTESHDGPISSIKFVPGEPLLVSSGHDNALRVWIFDQNDGAGRLLRFRSGHYEMPTRIRFYNNFRTILSSGEDKTLRNFDVFAAQQNVEISQGKILKRARQLNMKADDLKLPVIVHFSASTTRERDW
eukprot:CAMPEP_0117018634 /NCGR_PEP_ID=MMETSP0472-20121206/14386_1 /TAXON_ID=693140 ORGANISM="Tiarina fusus, Strain LIS" /NCGR_SAMPLE_ID=MMETSP0472 /ASSEMBLY_ACC=CAM_ASM_000603 /LENGTH=127 /DNA_ID=CAMNT_0004723343 /DNA_START=830 /DNA_END=1210 /DNA_ORIENTATION=-